MEKFVTQLIHEKGSLITERSLRGVVLILQGTPFGALIFRNIDPPSNADYKRKKGKDLLDENADFDYSPPSQIRHVLV